MEVFLARLAREAGRIAQDHQKTGFKVTTKGDGSPVTTADLAVSEFLVQHLRDKYPDDCFASEEDMPSPDECAAASRVWFIDPIDGTAYFLRRMPDYATLIGLWEEGAIIESAASFPAHGRLLYAKRGEGCYIDGRTMNVSSRGIDEARIACWGGRFNTLNTVNEDIMLPAYALSQIAAGELDGSLMVIEHWGQHDLAWSLPAIEEAGGRITDLNGAPLRFDDPMSPLPDTIAVSNGVIHDMLLEVA